MKTQARVQWALLAVVAALLPPITGCAPVFSELQSAKLAGIGRAEVTPSGSALYFKDDEDGNEHVENHVGLQVGTGVHERVDLRFRYERALDPDVNVVGFGPKVGLVRDRLAFAVPVGFAFGDEIDSGETWQAQPTLMGTLPLGKNAEWMASAKLLIPLTGEDRDTLWAVNTGFGLSSNLEKWVLRPEVGFCFNPGEDGYYTHVSVGLTIFMGKARTGLGAATH